MRANFLWLLIPVIVTAYWAYREQYETTKSIEKVHELKAQIGDARETLHWLSVEWNTLNRPERIMHLTDQLFDELQLVKVTEANFGNVESIPLLQEANIVFDPSSGLLLATQSLEMRQ